MNALLTMTANIDVDTCINGPKQWTVIWDVVWKWTVVWNCPDAGLEVLHYTISRLRTLCDTTLHDYLSNCWNIRPTSIASYLWDIVLPHSPLWVVFICVHQFYLCLLVLFCDYFHFQQMRHDRDSKWFFILEYYCHVSSGTVSVIYNTIRQAVLRTRKSWLQQQVSLIYLPQQRTQTETSKRRAACLPFWNENWEKTKGE